jgi:hypothetical protein
MPGPMAIAAAASLGASALSTLFGPSQQDILDETQRRNQQLLRERLSQAMQVYGRRGEFFANQMGLLNPQLAFADTQGRQAADVGARSAQAGLRRRLGSSGDIFSAALSSGSRTAATNQQNTLRSLATTEAMRAADREIMGRQNLIMGQPMNMFQPGQSKSGEMSGLFANIGTGLGYLAQNKNPNDPGKTTPPDDDYQGPPNDWRGIGY